MGNQQSSTEHVVSKAHKKRTGGSAFQCLIALDSTGEAQLKKNFMEKKPIEINQMFNRYQVGAFQEAIKKTTTQVQAKLFIKSLLDDLINEVADVVTIPLTQAHHEKLSYNSYRTLEYLDLPQACFQTVISNDQRWTSYDQEYFYIQPHINQVEETWKPVVIKKRMFNTQATTFRVQKKTPVKPMVTPRFGSVKITQEMVDNVMKTPDVKDVSVSPEAEADQEIIELPNTPKIVVKIRQWETVSGRLPYFENVEKESFRTAAPSQTQSSKFTMGESLRCHTNRVDNSQIEAIDSDGTIKIVKKKNQKRKNKFALTPMPAKQASIFEAQPRYFEILRALQKEEIKRKQIEKINMWDWNA